MRTTPSRSVASLLGVLLVVAGLVAGTPGAALGDAVFTVNSTGDGGDVNLGDGVCDASAIRGVQCTLRAAIQESNTTTAHDDIHFRIGGTTPLKTIAPSSQLPAITQPATIDGSTQPGSSANTTPIGPINAVLRVALVGTNAGSSAIGLIPAAKGVVVRGLVIERFGGDGIQVIGPGGVTVAGCFIGSGADGTTDQGNGGTGVVVGAPSVRIGGTQAADRNLISGNGGDGIRIAGSNARAALVQGNLIGTRASAQTAVPNDGDGVDIRNAPSALVRGNLAGGNGRHGVQVFGAGSTGVRILGNTVGRSFSPSLGAANEQDGVHVNDAPGVRIGGTGTNEGNVINSNTFEGVAISGTHAVGVTLLGNSIEGNEDAGVLVNSPNVTIGGTVAGSRNVVSGNQASGIDFGGFGGTGGRVLGNFIGVDAAGNSAEGNQEEGVKVNAPSGVVIGGTTAAARNVISGNADFGVFLRGDGNTVEGNFIGRAAGGAEIGNDGGGVGVSLSTNGIIGGSGGAANVISGNGGAGVFFFDDLPGTPGDNSLRNNLITGNQTGVHVEGTGDTVVSNLITANIGAGVEVASPGAGARITANRITANTALGIDLIAGSDPPSGVTPNDADDPDGGANRLQNFPVITSASRNSSTNVTTIQGTLDSTPSRSFRIEWFVVAADGSGHGEANTFLGFSSAGTNASGDATLSFATSGLTSGQQVTATAIDTTTNDTSEFAANVTVITAPG